MIMPYQLFSVHDNFDICFFRPGKCHINFFSVPDNVLAAFPSRILLYRLFTVSLGFVTLCIMLLSDRPKLIGLCRWDLTLPFWYKPIKTNYNHQTVMKHYIDLPPPPPPPRKSKIRISTKFSAKCDHHPPP